MLVYEKNVFLYCIMEILTNNQQLCVMDFKDSIKRLSERIESLKDNLPTEEATKTALVMPFISALGYDVFNPLEVLPEMCCDIGTKKGEKIDYAILRDDEPIILIECKHWQQNLTLHDNQLLRYFHVSKAKFGILTNGVIYRFYTDLVEPNKMDEKPFLEVNLLEVKDEQIEELKKFHRSYFDIDSIMSTANDLKYVSELRAVIEQEFSSPSPDLVKLLGKQVYDGVFTPKILEQFTTLLKRTIKNYINAQISERLNAAIQSNETPVKVEMVEDSVAETSKGGNSKVVTTEEEIQAYYIVKAILRGTIPAERITYRDAQSYFSVFLDDNNRKPVCRLYLDSPTNKRITFIDESKQECHNKISSIDEIYDYADKIIESAQRFV